MKSLPEYENSRMLAFWNLWIIWKSKNEFIFNKRYVHPIEDVRPAVDANMEWHQNVIHVNSGFIRKPVKSSNWDPPPRYWGQM